MLLVVQFMSTLIGAGTNTKMDLWIGFCELCLKTSTGVEKIAPTDCRGGTQILA